MRRTVLCIALCIGLIGLASCAGGLGGFAEPQEGKNLIIGSVIFENNGYQNHYEVYFDNLEVAVIGYYKENGEDKLFGKWVFTDKNGYFSIPNVPDGRYALKGIRVNLSGRAYLTVANEFKSAVDSYQLQPSENIPFSGRHFNTTPRNRIVNLKHNYFTIFQNREIRHGAYDKIAAFVASSGDTLSRPLIFKYFMEKYPSSGWKEYLQKELSRFE